MCDGAEVGAEEVGGGDAEGGEEEEEPGEEGEEDDGARGEWGAEVGENKAGVLGCTYVRIDSGC